MSAKRQFNALANDYGDFTLSLLRADILMIEKSSKKPLEKLRLYRMALRAIKGEL